MEALLAQILARCNHIIERMDQIIAILARVEQAPIVSHPDAFQRLCPHCHTLIEYSLDCSQCPDGLVEHAFHHR